MAALPVSITSPRPTPRTKMTGSFISRAAAGGLTPLTILACLSIPLWHGAGEPILFFILPTSMGKFWRLHDTSVASPRTELISPCPCAHLVHPGPPSPHQQHTRKISYTFCNIFRCDATQQSGCGERSERGQPHLWRSERGHALPPKGRAAGRRLGCDKGDCRVSLAAIDMCAGAMIGMPFGQGATTRSTALAARSRGSAARRNGQLARGSAMTVFTRGLTMAVFIRGLMMAVFYPWSNDDGFWPWINDDYCTVSWMPARTLSVLHRNDECLDGAFGKAKPMLG